MGIKSKQTRKRIFSIGSFNVRGITGNTKQKQLIRDICKYNVDICCLQETKIKNEIDIKINEKQIITFGTDKMYGNGFVISKKWIGSIHKYWKVSERICVLQLKTNGEMMPNERKPNHIITIINVYGPTSERARKHTNETEKNV